METLSIPQLQKDFARNVASRHYGFARRHGLEPNTAYISLTMPTLVDFIRLVRANRDHIYYLYMNQNNLRMYAWVREPNGTHIQMTFSADVD
jgi:hypothetical protein